MSNLYVNMEEPLTGYAIDTIEKESNNITITIATVWSSVCGLEMWIFNEQIFGKPNQQNFLTFQNFPPYGISHSWNGL